MTSRVTALVSAYFAKDYLAGRLDNLLSQTDIPEVIVIAQKDSAEADIADKYAVETILTDGIPTIYEAWNMGAKAAQTPYLTSANCDDRLAKNAIKTMADILDKETTYGVVYPDVEIVDEIAGEPVGRYDWIEGDFDELLRGCFIGPMPVWRKSLHERFGYFDEKYHVAGDYEFWLRLMKQGVKFYHMRGGPLGAYLKRETSAEHREPLRSLWEANNARLLHREVVKC